MTVLVRHVNRRTERLASAICDVAITEFGGPPELDLCVALTQGGSGGLRHGERDGKSVEECACLIVERNEIILRSSVTRRAAADAAVAKAAEIEAAAVAVTIPLELRAMVDSDRHYVLSSWLRSYAAKGRDSRDYGERHSQFCDDYAPVVRSLLARSTVLVAGLANTPDVIAGWAAWEGDTLHYILTKPNFRRMGVASWLLKDFASMPVAYTHRTSDALRCPIPQGWAYRRYRIWPPEEKAA